MTLAAGTRLGAYEILGSLVAGGMGEVAPSRPVAGSDRALHDENQRIMIVPYAAAGDSFAAENPRLWSEGRFRRSAALQYRPFDLHSDGQRFALAVPTGTESAELDEIVLVFNFFDELRRIAPTGKR